MLDWKKVFFFQSTVSESASLAWVAIMKKYFKIL